MAAKLVSIFKRYNQYNEYAFMLVLNQYFTSNGIYKKIGLISLLKDMNEYRGARGNVW